MHSQSTTVGTLMTPGPLDDATATALTTLKAVGLSATASVQEAAALMTFLSVSHLAVLAGGGKVAGVLHASDILSWVAHGGRP